ncbi:hypothetical protein MC378_13960 [Polaribacter sp. MSW13]|uniref:Uncharacterized protein n=1 Tax=Polaribacter marinus TaxID=2916838 RepID=A0A9X2ANU4_9FLAO|nr:hypothetical protein [Polaribacter marinus]MCI2230279.1 hypothetical protein [Polaribacter marinus]
MRRIKYLSLVFVFLVTISAQEQNETKISDETIEDISKKICSASIAYRTVSAKTAGKDIEDLILVNIGVLREDPKYREKLTKFWNEHSEKLICYEGPEDETRNPQHFLKRIVDLGMYKSVLCHFLLSDKDEYPIDVNSVEIYNGKEETFLDYLNEIISKPDNEKKYNIKEIKMLRLTIIQDYNAKTASELKN